MYDFEAWGPKDIYNYIYILVMIIGVASLTYQVIGYQIANVLNFKSYTPFKVITSNIDLLMPCIFTSSYDRCWLSVHLSLAAISLCDVRSFRSARVSGRQYSLPGFKLPIAVPVMRYFLSRYTSKSPLYKTYLLFYLACLLPYISYIPYIVESAFM